MGDERRTIMMLALTVEPIGGGDWRWRWYDHDSNLTLADGVEGDVVAAWRAATTHHVKSADEVLRTIRARAETAEQRAEAAERELARARAEGEAAGRAAVVAAIEARLSVREAEMEALLRRRGPSWVAGARVEELRELVAALRGEHVGAAGGAR